MMENHDTTIMQIIQEIQAQIVWQRVRGLGACCLVVYPPEQKSLMQIVLGQLAHHGLPHIQGYVCNPEQCNQPWPEGLRIYVIPPWKDAHE